MLATLLWESLVLLLTTTYLDSKNMAEYVGKKSHILYAYVCTDPEFILHDISWVGNK